MSKQSITVLPSSRAQEWAPRAGELAITIVDTSQATPPLRDGFSSVLRLASPGSGSAACPLTTAQARSVVAQGARHTKVPIMVSAQTHTASSAAIGLFLAAWHRRPLELEASDVRTADRWVLNRLRAAALPEALLTHDWNLLYCALFGSVARLTRRCTKAPTRPVALPAFSSLITNP